VNASAGRPPRVLTRTLDRTGDRVLAAMIGLREMAAFALITLSVLVTKFGVSRRVVHPLIFAQVRQAGLRLLPMMVFLGLALGLLIISQTVALLSRVGAEAYIGTVMVSVLVRELGPLLTALVVLARAGTANVVELGTMRAAHEIGALESLGIDPIHYLVMPRMLGLAISVFCLATYLVLVAIVSGWLFAFVQEVPLRPSAYFGQLGDALRWQDFALFGLKTFSFGAVIAIVSCHQGLARPLSFEEISSATERTVVAGLVGCVLLDVVFLVGYVFV